VAAAASLDTSLIWVPLPGSMLRSATRGAVVLLIFLAACHAGLPTEPVGLAGTWASTTRWDEGCVFQDDQDGRWGGFWYGTVDGARVEGSMATVRYAYPAIEVEMTSTSGRCWPAGIVRDCTVRGALMARNRMRLGDEEYVRGTN
jgi:hypothetical protein